MLKSDSVEKLEIQKGPGGGGVAGALYIQDFRGNDIEICNGHQRHTYQLSCCG